MGVGVVEGGQHGRPGRVDDLGGGADQPVQAVRVGGQGGDPVAGDGDGAPRRLAGDEGVHGGRAHQQVGGGPVALGPDGPGPVGPGPVGLRGHHGSWRWWAAAVTSPVTSSTWRRLGPASSVWSPVKTARAATAFQSGGSSGAGSPGSR